MGHRYQHRGDFRCCDCKRVVHGAMVYEVEDHGEKSRIVAFESISMPFYVKDFWHPELENKDDRTFCTQCMVKMGLIMVWRTMPLQEQVNVKGLIQRPRVTNGRCQPDYSLEEKELIAEFAVAANYLYHGEL